MLATIISKMLATIISNMLHVQKTTVYIYVYIYAPSSTSASSGKAASFIFLNSKNKQCRIPNGGKSSCGPSGAIERPLASFSWATFASHRFADTAVSRTKALPGVSGFWSVMARFYFQRPHVHQADQHRNGLRGHRATLHYPRPRGTR